MAQGNGDARAEQAFPPKLLRSIPRWIPWTLSPSPHNGRTTKRPHGSTLRPEDWIAYDPDIPLDRDGGLGFVLTGRVQCGRGTLVAFDLDACVTPGTNVVEPWALEFVAQHGRSYTEITPSGTGLRQWVIVENPPAALPVIPVGADPPPGVDKRPEIQVYGLGAAGYVTVTGKLLPGCRSDFETLPDLRWLEHRYGVAERDAEAFDVLPVGTGAPPGLDAVEAAVISSPDGQALVEGRWQDLELPSASEAWWRLVRAATRAARRHGRAVVDFLLHRTAFGRGMVDSRDAGKYQKPEWVARDVCRIVGKANETPAAEVFDDVPEDWQPPASARKTEAPWLLPYPEFAKTLDNVRFLFYGLLPARGLAQLFGDPGCGKTPFALSMALHVALGRPWFGIEPDVEGAVVYMVGEDPTGIRDRIQAECLALGVTPEQLRDRFFVTTRPGRLIDPENRARWVQEIRATVAEPVRVVVVDTQNRNFGAGNENSTEDMTTFVEQLDALSRALGALVVLVHHTGHLAKERSRGSSTLPAAIDAQFEITRRGRAVTMRPTKSKNMKEPEPLVGTLTAVTLGQDDKGRPVTAITLETRAPDPAEVFGEDEGLPHELHELLEAVRATNGKKVTQTELAERCRCSRKKLRSTLAAALDTGLVVPEGEGTAREQRGQLSAKRGQKCAYFVTAKGLSFLEPPGNSVTQLTEVDVDRLLS